MKATKFPALTALTAPELAEKASAHRRALFALRVQAGQRSLSKTADLRVTRRELARVLTAAARKAKEKAA
jgi:ribosomal protein L29